MGRADDALRAKVLAEMAPPVPVAPKPVVLATPKPVAPKKPALVPYPERRMEGITDPAEREQMRAIRLDPTNEFDRTLLGDTGGETPTRPDEYWILRSQGMSDPEALAEIPKLRTLGTVRKGEAGDTASPPPPEADDAGLREETERIMGALPEMRDPEEARRRITETLKKKNPEMAVAAAAKSADIRKRAQKLIQEEGLRGVLGLGPDATPAQILRATEAANDTTFQHYLRYKRDQVDASLPEGQKLKDRPEDDPLRQAVDRKALEDVATLRTVGLWGPKGIAPVERDPNSIVDALKPQAEVLGLNESGVPVVRQESGAAELGDLMQVPTYLATATGVPDAILRTLEGEAPGAKKIERTGTFAGIPVPLDPSALRERRTFSDVVADTDPGHIVERGAALAAKAIGKTPEEQARIAKAAGETALGKMVNAANTAQLATAAAITDIAFPDTLMVAGKALSLTGKGGKAVAHGLGLTSDLGSEVKRAEALAETAERHRTAMADLVKRGASADEVKRAVTLAEAEYEADKAALKQTAQDAVEDAARVRTKAEQAAEEAASKRGVAAKPYNAPMQGTLADASKAEAMAAMKPNVQAPRMALTEGLKRAMSLMEAKPGKTPALTPTQVAAYAERLFDTAAKTSRELAAGGREALSPTPQRGAISAMVDAVEFSPRMGGSPEREELEKVIDAIGAARRRLSGSALAKAEEKLRPMLTDAVRKAAEKGIPARPAEILAFRKEAIAAVQPHLVGDVASTTKRATALVGEAIRTHATPGRIDTALLAAVDKIVRAHGTEAAEVARRAAPLRSVAPAILKGESASRFRALQANPTGMNAVKTSVRKALGAAKAIFIGGDEMAPWAKEGLSAETKAWTEGVVRRLEAVASDVGKIEDAAQAADYLRGVPQEARSGFLTDGVDRARLFLDHAKVEYGDIIEYMKAMLAPPVGRPEPDFVRLGGIAVPKLQRTFEMARAGAITTEEMIERMHETLRPFTVPDADLSLWSRITAGWIGGTAEQISALNHGFGDGVVLTKADVEAVEALAGGRFNADIARALDPAAMVQRAVGARGRIGPGATESVQEVVEGVSVPRGGVVSVPTGMKGGDAFGLYDGILDSEVYIPRMARDRIAAAAARTYKPQTKVGNAALSWWKLAVTRGALTSKPGYLVNNMPGDMEQVYLKFGIQTALKAGIRSEGASLAALVHTGAAGRMVGMVAPGPAGAVAGGVAETGLGLLAAMFVGKNKGWLAKVMHGTADVGEKAGRAVSNLLSMASFRLEVTQVLDGGERTIAIGDKVWTARELREVGIRGGVWDSFDRAELAAHVGALGKAFHMPAEGVQHLAETVGLRRRVGLYVTLIEDGMTPEQAAKGVVEALFDYRGTLSEGDKHWLRQVLFPFWSWQKNMNRLVLGSITSPLGAYRLKQVVALDRLGRKAGDQWSEGVPSAEGDDVGILTAFIPEETQPAYEKFRRYKDAVEKKEGAIPAADWNALLLRSNTSIPVTMTWARNEDIPASLHLTDDEVASLHTYVAPWYTPEMAKSYLRDRTQFRMGHNEPAEGGMGEADSFWHVVAPPSGVEASLTWFAQAALALTTLVGAGEGSPMEQVLPLTDPSRAPILGPLVASFEPGGRPADKVSQVFGRWLSNTSVGDGLWDAPSPGVKIDDKRGEVTYTLAPWMAAVVTATPGIADLNRALVATEGPKGGSYSPDALRLLLGGYGLSTPTVTTNDALREGLAKKAWADAQLPEYRVDRDAEGKPLAR